MIVPLARGLRHSIRLGLVAPTLLSASTNAFGQREVPRVHDFVRARLAYLFRPVL